MTLQSPKTKGQLEIYRALQEINQQWLVLWVVLGLFTLGFLVFLASLFFAPSVATAVLGALNSGLFLLLRHMVHKLFPGGKPWWEWIFGRRR